MYLYFYRITVTLACPMNFILYPMGRQKCSLQLASYAWPKDDVEYVWRTTNPIQLYKTQYKHNTSLPLYTLEIVSKGTDDVTTATSKDQYTHFMQCYDARYEYNYIYLYQTPINFQAHTAA